MNPYTNMGILSRIRNEISSDEMKIYYPSEKDGLIIDRRITHFQALMYVKEIFDYLERQNLKDESLNLPPPFRSLYSDISHT